MGLFVRLLLVVLVHFIFFVCYPYTGGMGTAYGLVSLILWCGFVLFVNPAIAAVTMFFSPLKLIANLLLVSAMAFAIATTMPQYDQVSVYSKILNRHYPDTETIRDGLSRFRLSLPDSVFRQLKHPKAIKRLSKQ